ncbi:MAG: hypothetical protein KJ053_10580 [Dehalococcoidia bacterium]|nr:hypothetical protein [Dehalococcoidia bacterium]
MVTDVETTPTRAASEWAAGYRAGVAAALAEIESLGRPHMQGFNAPLLTHVRERIQQLDGRCPPADA